VQDETDLKPVIVTTEYRGVFFGYLKADHSPGRVILTRARNCIYWSSDVRGFVGLAATGPSESCNVGPETPEMTLFGITSIAACTPAAVEAWRAAPWSS
jgi:hypothetical protein